LHGRRVPYRALFEVSKLTSLQEEAFDIWSEWSLLYPRLSPARKLLEGIAGEWWLVSLIHHDYKDAGALWRFLLEDDTRA
jgi:methylenetetrahydrofolate reductase (NADPH)